MAARPVPAPVLRIPRQEVARIRAHGEEAFPEEACGFLLGTSSAGGDPREVVLARPAENQHGEEPTRRFLIPPLEVMGAESEAMALGLDVIGFYHSHPSGIAKPSEFDREHAWPWYSYVIVAVTDAVAGEVASWRLADDRSTFMGEDMVQI